MFNDSNTLLILGRYLNLINSKEWDKLDDYCFMTGTLDDVTDKIHQERDKIEELSINFQYSSENLTLKVKNWEIVDDRSWVWIEEYAYQSNDGNIQIFSVVTHSKIDDLLNEIVNLFHASMSDFMTIDDNKIRNYFKKLIPEKPECLGYTFMECIEYLGECYYIWKKK